jgi:hypothetical protein
MLWTVNEQDNRRMQIREGCYVTYVAFWFVLFNMLTAASKKNE